MTVRPPLTASVREIRHEVRINLTDAPSLTNLVGSTRKPFGLRLTYGVRRDIARVDIVVEWQDSAEHWTPVVPMPEWLLVIIEEHRPSDVDEPDDYRPAGLGGIAITPRVAVSEDAR